jgi:hypothetical protein
MEYDATVPRPAFSRLDPLVFSEGGIHLKILILNGSMRRDRKELIPIIVTD